MAEQRICEIPACGKAHYAKGVCEMHRRRILKHGSHDVVKSGGTPRQYTACTIGGCDGRHQAKGLCYKHYRRLHEHGDPHALKRRPAGDGSSFLDSNGYVRVRPWRGKESVAEHRLIMERLVGRPLIKGENVHHINGDRADNRPENLELWVTLQPSGQRPEDLLAYAREIIARYG